MQKHDLTFDATDLAALRQLVGRRLLSRQSVHPWFANVWEGSLRMDLVTDDDVVSFEGVFSPEVIDGLADQLLRLRVRSGDGVGPWTLHGHQGRGRKADDTYAKPRPAPVIEQVRIIREEVRVEDGRGTSLVELTLDLGVLVTLGHDPDEPVDPDRRFNRDEVGDCFIGIHFLQHEPMIRFGWSSGTTFRFGIHTYPGAVNWLLEPGQRLVHARFLVDPGDAEEGGAKRSAPDSSTLLSHAGSDDPPLADER